MIKPSKKLIVAAIILIGLGGWGLMQMDSKPQTDMQGGVITVKAMQVVQQDTPIDYEFVGKVASKNEVKIMSKVSGNIVEKMVNGGDTVYRGQPLFRVDNKQYLSAITSAQAALAKSQALSAIRKEMLNVTGGWRL